MTVGRLFVVGFGMVGPLYGLLGASPPVSEG